MDCNLKSCIIVPLYEGNEVTKTLKLYSTKEKGISYTHEKLALGLSQLMSTQMELSKVTNLKAPGLQKQKLKLYKLRLILTFI